MGLDGTLGRVSPMPPGSEMAYPTHRSTWYMPYARTGSGPTGLSITFENNNINGVFWPLRYALAFDAMWCAVATANAGAGAVVRLGAYQVNAAPSRSGEWHFAGASLLVDAGTASINSTGNKTLTHTRVVAVPPGILLVLAPQSVDTALVRPTFDIATLTPTGEQWLLGNYDNGQDNRISPCVLFGPGVVGTWPGGLPAKVPPSAGNYQGVSQAAPWIAVRAA